MTCQPTNTPENVDIEEIRSRYRQERDKRLRPEGHAQYAFVDEPDWQDYNDTCAYPLLPPRGPVSEDVEVAILGAGFAGMLAAVRLQQAGIDGFRILENGGDFGGTWYWNRYPGLQCDVESYVYLPLLEETDYVPSKKYSDGPEIFEHCRRVGRQFSLYERALFGTEVQALHWDETVKRWRITTKQGDEIRARFAIMALGLLNRPKLPGIPGIRDFKGHSFHTARWDYDYTGGSQEKPVLSKLTDKRVAVIGTGSTGIQVIPELAEYAAHLYVFQRTPSYVSERGNCETDPEWARSLGPGWQDARRRNAAGTLMGFAPGVEDQICDGWSEMSRNLQETLRKMGNPALSPAEVLELRFIEEFKLTERIRQLTDEVVKDPETADKLKAWYRHGCKRPCFSDDYLQTFNRPNVALVDVSASKGVDRVTDKGLVAGGIEYPVDCIVFASGYEFSAEPRSKYGLAAIDGRGGVSLYDQWTSDTETFHGALAPNFPNLFFTGYTQGALGNVTLMYELQADHIAYIISEARKRCTATVEPTAEGMRDWEDVLRSNAPNDAAYWEECTPGHYNAEGEKHFRSPLGGGFTPGFYAFYDMLAQWRDEAKLEGLKLDGKSSVGAVSVANDTSQAR